MRTKTACADALRFLPFTKTTFAWSEGRLDIPIKRLFDILTGITPHAIPYFLVINRSQNVLVVSFGAFLLKQDSPQFCSIISKIVMFYFI